MEEHVNHPKHYNETAMECIDAMEIAFGNQALFDFCRCNAFKYLWRYKNKNGLEDLEKANWYLAKALTIKKNEESIHTMIKLHDKYKREVVNEE